MAKTPKHKPHNSDLDRALGQRLKALRRALGDSQAALGEKVGLTYQQVQKYENGANRVSALMLVKLADALNTSPTEVLRGMEPAPGPASHSSAGETERLLEAFGRIRSPASRASVLQIVLDLAAAEA